MKVVVNNLLVHYHLEGQGQTVLLLHGWGDSSRGLKVLQDDLAKSYQVVALDLPGFGDSEPPKKPWGLENYADFVGEFLKKLDLPELHAAIGHSHGGATLIKAVSKGAIKSQRLILIASSGIRSGLTLRKVVLKIVAKTGNLATIWMPDRYRTGLRDSLYSAAGSDLLVVPGMEETFKRVVKEDIKADAAKITTPTLLIYADNDKATPPSMGMTYNKLIKDSKLELVKDSGHFIHLDQPDKTISLIRGFLK